MGKTHGLYDGIWESADENEQAGLLLTELLGYVSVPRMHRLLGDSLDVDFLRKSLDDTHLYRFKADRGLFQPTKSFSLFLREKICLLDDRRSKSIYALTARHHMQNNRVFDALTFYEKSENIEEAFEILSCDDMTIVPHKGSFTEIGYRLYRMCPEDLKRKYPLIPLRLAYAFAAEDDMKKADSLLSEVKESLGKVSGDERMLLEGEWLFMSSLIAYPEIETMVSLIDRAAEVLAPIGNTVRGLSAREPFLYSLTGPIAILLRTPGRAEETSALFERYVNRYTSLTQGGGAGSFELFKGALMYYRGEIEQSELWCHKALYRSKCHEQLVVRMGTARHLLYIATLRLDRKGFTEALKELHETAETAKIDRIHYRNVFKYEYADIFMGLGDCSRSEMWQGDDIDAIVPRRQLCYLFFQRMICHMFRGEYIRAIALADALLTEKNDMGVVIKGAILLYRTLAYQAIGNQAEAEASAKQAIDILFPDGLFQMYALFSSMIEGDYSAYIETNFPDRAPRAYEVIRANENRWEQFVTNYPELFGRVELSEREKEIARLAAQGKYYREIAEETGLSINTIKTHLKNIFQKYELTRKSDLVNILGEL